MRAQLRLAGALPDGRREPAHNHPGDQEDAERGHVPRVRDREVVAWLDEEEVEREHRGDGRGERRDLAVTRGNEEDREQVDDAEPGDRGHALQERDRAGGHADGRDRLE